MFILMKEYVTHCGPLTHFNFLDNRGGQWHLQGLVTSAIQDPGEFIWFKKKTKKTIRNNISNLICDVFTLWSNARLVNSAYLVKTYCFKFKAGDYIFCYCQKSHERGEGHIFP